MFWTLQFIERQSISVITGGMQNILYLAIF